MTILVEMFSAPGCAKCAASRDALKQAAQSLGTDAVAWREVNVLEEVDRAVELDVMTPPSIAIDGELVFPKLPAPERLLAELRERARERASK